MRQRLHKSASTPNLHTQKSMVFFKRKYHHFQWKSIHVTQAEMFANKVMIKFYSCYIWFCSSPPSESPLDVIVTGDQVKHTGTWVKLEISLDFKHSENICDDVRTQLNNIHFWSTSSYCFFFLSFVIVMQKHQGKFLVCENLLVNNIE